MMHTCKDLAETQTEAIQYCRKARLSCKQIQELTALGFFFAPASLNHHLATKGGLAAHSMNVVDNLLSLGAFKDEESAYRVGMLHDLVKAFNYTFDADTGKFTWRESCYPGHGVASVFHAEDLGVTLQCDERQAIIWHMGAFGLKEDRYAKTYGEAVSIFPRQVILTHAADHLASALEGDEPAAPETKEA